MGSADNAAQGEQMAPLGQGGGGIPTPAMGVGAVELATDSNDPAVLRELLERARERLAFYESFDRIIGENIRRSGELMVETVALREQAKAQAEHIRAEREAFDAARQADQERYRELVQGALDDVAATRPVIDQLIERLQEALGSLGKEPATSVPEPAATETATPAEEFTPEPPTEPELELDATLEAPSTEAESESSPQAPPAPETTIAPAAAAEERDTHSSAAAETSESIPAQAEEAAATEGPRTVEILAHGVTTAAIAISLQRTLRELAHVRTVEAREFADGVLRLQVQAEARIDEPDLEAWLEKHEGRIANASDRVVEINLGTTPAT